MQESCSTAQPVIEVYLVGRECLLHIDKIFSKEDRVQSDHELIPEAYSCRHAQQILIEGLNVRHRLCFGQGVHLASWVN